MERCLGCDHTKAEHRGPMYSAGLLVECSIDGCTCEQYQSPRSPWADENKAAQAVEDAPREVLTAALVAMTPEQHAAHVEFRAAAKEAVAAQHAAQAAAHRYAIAVRTLSEVFGGDGGPQ